MIIVVKLEVGVFLENWLHLLAAMYYLKVVSNLIMAYFSVISQLLIVNS
jgi:hypothetical protein